MKRKYSVTIRTHKRKGKEEAHVHIKRRIKDKVRESEYFYNPNIKIDTYVVAAKQRDLGKRYSVKTLHKADTYSAAEKPKKEHLQKALKTMRSYIKSVSKKGSIDSNITSGVTRYETSAEALESEGAEKAYRQLLRPLVRDEQFLDLIIANADKFKHRFNYETEITGRTEKGETKKLAHINDIGHRTIRDYIADYVLNNTFKVAARGTPINSNWQLNTTRHLRLLRDDVNRYTDGTITSTKVIITFRRG